MTMITVGYWDAGLTIHDSVPSLMVARSCAVSIPNGPR